MTPTQTTCQEEMTFLREKIRPFLQAVEEKRKSASSSISLSLQNHPLAIFLSQQREKNTPLLFITNLAPKKQTSLYTSILAWQQFFSVNNNWHHIEEGLSEQELLGLITTPQSIAFHHLLAQGSQKQNFLISASALNNLLPDPELYEKMGIHLTVGEERVMQTIITSLTKAGYIRQRQTVEPGTFKVSGETIQLTHPILSGTYHITFHGSTIERLIHTIDRRTSDISSLTIPPVAFPTSGASWPSLLKKYVVVTDSTLDLPGTPTIFTNAIHPELQFPIQECSDPIPQAGQEKTTLFLYENKDHAEELANLHHLHNVTFCSQSLSKQDICLTSDELLIVSETHLSPKEKTHSPITHERALELIGELKVGLPAVHTDHGIGIFEGTSTRQVGAITKEYLVLRYAEGDALFTPVEYAHKITPYLGEKTPLIHRLHGSSWIKTKKQAKGDAIAFAKELLAIARKRNDRQRSPYVLNEIAEQELHTGFAYTLTPDQERTWQEVKEDLVSTTPLDRLIVGDVGFGKTEIAIRACYHAIQNGKQVAILAPTTLLVQQHFDTFVSRLPQIKNKIGMLSRFVSPAHQKKVRSQIATKELMVVIGTHGLISPQTKWQELGLVVIDEEQRFGVKQKESFKAIRAEVDVLSLSATPIPRTLSMALSGLRQLSLITTPPPERKDVTTTVARLTDTLLKKAIREELHRHGQIYVVAPKIRHLATIQEHIKALVPKARVAIAHGQMEDRQLSAIIHQFDAGDIDILISSTIVENGLDLPNANTMIVWHAPHFGLSDLYQLRGRIGRRHIQGHAYFLFNQSELTQVQRQRLSALTEASRLGSGWLIAQRDLEIRGAGNLLGAEQSGAVTSVGVGLYLDMVQNAMHAEEEQDVLVELPFPALLPPHYIADTDTRTRWYTRLTRATEDHLETHEKTLVKNFGPLPEETKNLLCVIRLQKRAARVGIKSISAQTITPPDEYPYERITMTAKKLPQVLEKIGNLGAWRVQQDKAILDMDTITTSFIDQLLSCLA